MKNICSLFFFFTTLSLTANNIELTITGAQQTKMPLAIMVLDDKNSELMNIAKTIQKDFLFTEQFKPCIKKYSSDLSKKEIAQEINKLAQSGTPLALCISAQSPTQIGWRLYDTFQKEMLCGKKYIKKGEVVRGWAHNIADAAWKKLTDHDGFFSSRLAYCKDIRTQDGAHSREIYMCDYDGSNPELVINPQTVVVAPRWHNKKPLLYFSEYTDTNVRLVSCTLNKQQTPATISSFDEGIAMLIDFAPDGGKYAFCATGGNGSSQIYLHKNNKLKRCTRNKGNNTSPIFLDEEHICFCSDFQTGNPQIYIGNIVTGHLQRITQGGYCTSPAYCPETDQIAYHKMIKGTMQIMVYDRSTKAHCPYTNDAGNKQESSWSPGGSYLLFAHETTLDESKLAQLNMTTRRRRYIDTGKDYCCYPRWSPTYENYPVMV